MKIKFSIIAIIFIVLTGTTLAQTTINVTYSGSKADIIDFAFAYFTATEDSTVLEFLKHCDNPIPKTIEDGSQSGYNPGYITVSRKDGFLFYQHQYTSDIISNTTMCYWNCNDKVHVIFAVSQGGGCCGWYNSNVEFYRYNKKSKQMIQIDPPFNRKLRISDFVNLKSLSKKMINKLHKAVREEIATEFHLPKKGKDIIINFDLTQTDLNSNDYQYYENYLYVSPYPILKWNGNGYTITKAPKDPELELDY